MRDLRNKFPGKMQLLVGRRPLCKTRCAAAVVVISLRFVVSLVSRAVVTGDESVCTAMGSPLAMQVAAYSTAVCQVRALLTDRQSLCALFFTHRPR